MRKTIDPILILKDHFSNNKKIEKQGTNLVFEDGTKLKLDIPTAVLQTQTKKQYTLGSLWMYLLHRNDKLAAYIKECQKERIDTVNSLDKGNNLIFNIIRSYN